MWKGIWTVVVSFFSMPLKLLKQTKRQLIEIGKEASFDLAQTDVPFLTWLGVAGKMGVCLIYLLGLVATLLFAVANLSHLRYALRYFNLFVFIGGIGGFVLMLVLGFLLTTLVTWILSVQLELILLVVTIANNVKQFVSISAQNDDVNE